jgi:hypothetical protein
MAALGSPIMTQAMATPPTFHYQLFCFEFASEQFCSACCSVFSSSPLLPCLKVGLTVSASIPIAVL